MIKEMYYIYCLKLCYVLINKSLIVFLCKAYAARAILSQTSYTENGHANETNTFKLIFPLNNSQNSWFRFPISNKVEVSVFFLCDNITDQMKFDPTKQITKTQRSGFLSVNIPLSLLM